MAERIRTVLGRALDIVAPPPRRPTDLVLALGLDKSLAGRLNRAAAADEPIEAVLDGAGVQGMRQAHARISAWAAQAGSAQGAAAAEQLHDAIESFSRACEAFPDGRVGLETAMAEHMPELRAVSERKARRSVFQAHSFLLGFHQEAAYRAVARVPSGDGQGVDVVFVEATLGLRVLRPGMSIVIGGAAAPVGPEGLRATTLDRRPAATLSELVIAQRCSVGPGDYLPQQRAGSAVFTLPESAPALGAPVDFAVGQVFPDVMRRRGSAEHPYDVDYSIFRKPVRVLVWDELFDPDLAAPSVLTTSFASGPGSIPTRPEDDTLYGVHQPEQFEDLGVGLGGVASRDVPDCAGLLESALRRAGVDPSRLAVRRVRIEYPTPHARMIAWIPLPPKE